MNVFRGKQKTTLSRLFFMSILVLGFLVWNPKNILSEMMIPFRFIAFPLEKSLAQGGHFITSALDFFASVGTLKQENETLSLENAQLMAVNALLQDESQENEMLRRQLDLLPRGFFQLQAAEIIGQNQGSIGDWVMIDRGSFDGVQKGMAVIVEKGVMVGIVSEVLLHQAKVMLLTSAESAVNGIDVTTQAKGMVRGHYGLGLIMDTILMTDTLQKDESVITSGLGGDVPAGLFLGKVISTKPSSDQLFQEASLNSMIDVSSLRVVFVILGKQ
jgi:rod shape-determining protein MreC